MHEKRIRRLKLGVFRSKGHPFMLSVVVVRVGWGVRVAGGSRHNLLHCGLRHSGHTGFDCMGHSIHEYKGALHTNIGLLHVHMGPHHRFDNGQECKKWGPASHSRELQGFPCLGFVSPLQTSASGFPRRQQWRPAVVFVSC